MCIFFDPSETWKGPIPHKEAVKHSWRAVTPGASWDMGLRFLCVGRISILGYFSGISPWAIYIHIYIYII